VWALGYYYLLNRLYFDYLQTREIFFISRVTRKKQLDFQWPRAIVRNGEKRDCAKTVAKISDRWHQCRGASIASFEL